MVASSSKVLTLFIVPMVTGTISFVSSSSLMFCILVYSQTKLKKVVRRMLFMFCIYDCIYSLGSTLSILFFPKETSEFALGNLITCDIQGVMAQLGFMGSALYTLSISVYYVAIIKFNKKEKDISKNLFEYTLHLIPNGFAILTTIFLAVKQQFGPLADGHGCYLSVYPRSCLADPDVECQRGSLMTVKYYKLLSLMPFLVIYFLVFCKMMIVCHHIIKQKRNADRWRMQLRRQHNFESCCCFAKRLKKLLQRNSTLQKSSMDVELGSSFTPTQKKYQKMQQALAKNLNTPGDDSDVSHCIMNATTSRSGTKHDPLAFNVHQVKNKIRRESMLDQNAPIIVSNKVSKDMPLRKSHARKSRDELASRKNKTAVTQCLLYVSSFLLCWIFPLIAGIFRIMRSPVPFSVLVLSRIFNPLQGFFFILVYSRPHVKSIQNSNPELNWFQAFAVAFKAGGDNDFGDNNLEVVDEEDIDAPRLRDSERERKQEIVRQQFKRKSVTYKPSALDASLKKEDVDHQSLVAVFSLGLDDEETELKKEDVDHQSLVAVSSPGLDDEEAENINISPSEKKIGIKKEEAMIDELQTEAGQQKALL